MSDTGDSKNRGQERSAEAREAAQERGAKAYGPGGNPLKQEDDGTYTDPTTGETVPNPVDEAGNPVETA